MASSHKVVQGEHFAAIAAAAGHRDFRELWKAAPNNEIRSLRKTPHILFPGDAVTVPKPQPKDESAPNEQRTRFVFKGVPLKLRIEVRGQANELAKGVACNLFVEGQGEQQALDGKGRVERVIPHSARAGRIIVRDEDHGLDVDADIEIGGLHPLDEVTGQMQRLNNLGYDAGDPTPEPAAIIAPSASASGAGAEGDDGGGPGDAPPTPPASQGGDDVLASPRAKMRFRSAVEEFQLDQGLKVDGVMGANTKAKLKEAYGC